MWQFPMYDADEHTSENEQSCQHGSTLLRLLCLASLVWTVVAKDMCETVTLGKWMWQFPMYDAEKDGPRLKDKDIGFLYIHLEKFDLAIPTTGATRFQQVSVVVLVLIKFCLGCALMKIAAAYVAHAPSNEDLLLNSVAMLFVLDVDELLYAVITPAFVRKMMEQMPGLVSHPKMWNDDLDRTLRELFSLWRMLFPWWSSAAVTAALHWSWCRAANPSIAVNVVVIAGAVVVVAICVVPCILSCLFVWAGLSAQEQITAGPQGEQV